jgi:DNA-binding CsgD family transcriptional regulator
VPSPPHRLSPREREMLALLAQGLSASDIARHLVLSRETVKSHVRNAMLKLDAHTRTHAVVLALEAGELARG